MKAGEIALLAPDSCSRWAAGVGAICGGSGGDGGQRSDADGKGKGREHEEVDCLALDSSHTTAFMGALKWSNNTAELTAVGQALSAVAATGLS